MKTAFSMKRHHCYKEEVELDDLDEWVKSDYCSDNIGININSSAVKADNVSGIPEVEIDF